MAARAGGIEFQLKGKVAWQSLRNQFGPDKVFTMSPE